jgi:hypothetical protein
VGDPGPAVRETDSPQERRRIYALSLQDDRIWQGEILSELPQLTLSLDSLPLIRRDEDDVGARPIRVESWDHPLAVVVSQDCDLEKDYRGRPGQRPFLYNVLLCDVREAEDLHQRLHAEENTSSKEWRTIRENRTPRFQFLSSVSAAQDALGLGLPSLAVDFRHYFTIRTDELYERIKYKLTMKRCRLQSPYADHLSHRFYSYQSRIALPVDHPTS